MFSICHCLRFMKGMVFYGKYQENTREPCLTPILCQDIETDWIPVIIKISERDCDANRESNEADIMQYLALRNPEILIPKVLSVFKLDSAASEHFLSFDNCVKEELEASYIPFDLPGSTVIIMEFVNGNVLTRERALMRNSDGDLVSLEIISRLLEGLHDASIVHGDIKCDNFIVSAPEARDPPITGDNIFLIDFDSSFHSGWDHNAENKWLPPEGSIEDATDSELYAYLLTPLVDWTMLLNMYHWFIFGKYMLRKEFPFDVNSLCREQCKTIVEGWLAK